jgi:hypothetical protein
MQAGGQVSGEARAWREGQRRRLLLAVPGLVAPVALLVTLVVWTVGWIADYHSMPLAQRLEADDAPIGTGGAMFLITLAFLFALLLLVPPLLAALPSRLRLWAGALAAVIQLLPLWASLSIITSGSAWGWLAFLLLAYVPTLVVVRLVGQSHALAPTDSLPGA